MNDLDLDTWAIIELFGHQRLAGKLSDHEIGGDTFLRVDVPDEDGDGFIATRLLGKAAIYAINFVDESLARQAAAQIKWRPFSIYDSPALRLEMDRVMEATREQYRLRQERDLCGTGDDEVCF